MRRSSNWKGGKNKTSHGYIEVYDPSNPRAMGRGYVYEHILVAEKALGKPLPLGAEVHHRDGDGTNNKSSNLVICENKKYHRLLHFRERAYRATGDPNARKCGICHRWGGDDMTIVKPNSSNGMGASYHRSCAAARARRRKARGR